MKFSIDRKSISDVLSLIQGITNKTTTLAITSDVLIKAEDAKITITANDLETVFQGTYDAEVDTDGIISINARKLFEIVREYPNAIFPVNEIENRWVELGEGNIQYHIVSSNYENFPEHPVMEALSFVEIDSSQLKKIVDVSASISFSKEEKRPYVLGALLEYVPNISDTIVPLMPGEMPPSVAKHHEKNDDTEKPTEGATADLENASSILRMVSTDSKRLYAFDIPFNGVFKLPEEGIIIPKKGLSELGKFLNNSGQVQLAVENNHFIVRKENEVMMIKLLEGEYPDYRRVLNINGFTPIHLSRTLFIMMMKRMSILVSEDYKSVIFNFKENELMVTITNPDIGESKEEIAIGYTGDFIESAFNPKFFIDALNAIKEDDVIMYIKDQRNPCILRGQSEKGFMSAIMAMSV